MKRRSWKPTRSAPIAETTATVKQQPHTERAQLRGSPEKHSKAASTPCPSCSLSGGTLPSVGHSPSLKAVRLQQGKANHRVLSTGTQPPRSGAPKQREMENTSPRFTPPVRGHHQPTCSYRVETNHHIAYVVCAIKNKESSQ